MRTLILVSALVSIAASASLNQYLPPGGQSSFGGGQRGGFSGGSTSGGYSAPSGGSYSAPSGGFSGGGSAGPQVPILRLDNDNSGDGNYNYAYETGNGIQAQERGRLVDHWVAADGGFSFTSPEGQQFSITYTADENGFHPQGAHLPTPPPIPEAILRSIEQNKADEARGEFNDGSYREEGAGGQGGHQGGYGGQGGHQGGYGGQQNRGFGGQQQQGYRY